MILSSIYVTHLLLLSGVWWLVAGLLRKWINFEKIMRVFTVPPPYCMIHMYGVQVHTYVAVRELFIND